MPGGVQRETVFVDGSPSSGAVMSCGVELAAFFWCRTLLFLMIEKV